MLQAVGSSNQPLAVEGSNIRDFAFSQRWQALLGTNVVGIIAEVNGNDTVLQFPDAVDHLVEEPAVMGHGDGQGYQQRK